MEATTNARSERTLIHVDRSWSPSDLPRGFLNGSRTVYALYDFTDQVVYVGCSRLVKNRLWSHRSKPWWPVIVAVEILVLDSLDEMVDFERLAIDRIQPRFNKAGVTSPHVGYRGCPR